MSRRRRGMKKMTVKLKIHSMTEKAAGDYPLLLLRLLWLDA